MAIRAASPADLEPVYRLGYDAWGEGLDMDGYLAACRASKKYASGTWWIYPGEDGLPAAALLAHAIPLPGGETAIGLGSIATSPDLRGKGLASRLIRQVIVLHEVRGASVFFLFSDIAPAFYERFGFRPVSAETAAPGAVFMVRANEAESAALFAHPNFVRPAYF